MVVELETILFAISILVGIVLFVIPDYWFDWQDYQKNKGTVVPFSTEYKVAAIFTGCISYGLSYLIVFLGLPYYFPEIYVLPESMMPFVYLIPITVGAVVAYIIDSVLFRKIADGSGASAWVKAQTQVQIAAEEAAAAALVAAKESSTQEKFLALATEKAASLGISTEDTAKIKELATMLRSLSETSETKEETT
jgi:hypothetical protein